MLVPCAGLYAAALAGVVAAAAAGAPAAVLLVLSAVAGAGLPILSSVTRALWPRLLPDPALVAAAYSLETAVQSATWVGGALLVAVLVALASPGAALLAAGALAVAGTLGVAGAAVARHDRAQVRATGRTGPLADAGRPHDPGRHRGRRSDRRRDGGRAGRGRARDRALPRSPAF